MGLKRLGNGVQKTAYVIEFPKKLWDVEPRRYVVKENTGGYGREEIIRPPDLSAFGIETIYQILAGNYIIQELTKVLCTVDYNHPAWQVYNEFNNKRWTIKDKNGNRKYRGDYHDGNFGVRADGSLVCFDW